METKKKKRKFSLSTNILIGLVLGLACGIFFGEYCASLQVIGDAFIMLLQMTVLPYIIASLILGIGTLTLSQSKILALKAGIILLIFWGIAFVIILLMPLSFPVWKSAAFFSTSLLETPPPVDFLNIYIPSNPFQSMSENVVPAVVLFSILFGVALIGAKNKEILLKGFSVASEVMVKITHFIVALTPIGIFAIAASAAGTITGEQLGQLQVYIISYNLASVVLIFCILPLLVTSVTPFKYKEVIWEFKDALITAFMTGNLFIILPMITEGCKALFKKHNLTHEKTNNYVDVIVPVSFNFPNVGKLLILLFVLFAGWFSGNLIPVSQYPTFTFAGLFSFFGSVNVALPFMLDLMHLPADLFRLYISTGVINEKTATLLAAVNLLTFTLLATYAMTYRFKIKLKKIITFVVVSCLITAGIIFGSNIYFNLAVNNEYKKDKIIAGMETALYKVKSKVYKEIPPPVKKIEKDNSKSRISKICEAGVLRVGYHPDNLPFSYFNTAGKLVGFDIDMANLLATELNCSVEFIPFKKDTLAQQLNNDDFDIAMSGVLLSADTLSEMKFSDPYLDTTAAFVVKDQKKHVFSSRKNLQSLKEVTIAVHESNLIKKKLKEYLPNAKIINITSIRDFFEKNDENIDAIFMNAEQGSTWTLLYPEYQVTIPKPDISKLSMGYPVAENDSDFADFLSQWVNLNKKKLDYKKIYDHWILGLTSTKKNPRWCIIRDVLGWVN